MTAIKSAVVGEADQEPSTETVTQVANEVYAQDVMRLMVVHMEAFEFEVSPGFRAWLGLSRSAGPAAVYAQDIVEPTI